MAAASLIPLIFLITGCLGRAPTQRTQGATAVAYSSPSGTTGAAAYSFQTNPNRLPPGAASPRPPAPVYPQSAPRGNAGPSNGNGGTYSQASAIHSSQGTTRYQAPPASLPPGAARPQQPPPTGSSAVRGPTQPQFGSSSVSQWSGAASFQAQAPAGPYPLSSSQRAPPVAALPRRAAPPVQTALPRGAASPQPPPPPPQVPQPLPVNPPYGAAPPPPPMRSVPLYAPPPSSRNGPAPLPPGAARRQSQPPAYIKPRLFSSVGVQRPLSYLELVAQQQAEIEYQNQLLVASTATMHNAIPPPVVTFFPPLPPAPAPAPAPSNGVQDPVYDQFTQPVEATFRLDAARDLDCETIPEVRSLNVDVYHPMSCDDDMCPKGKVCRTISNVGMCCPPSVTGDVITSKGRLGRAEYFGLAWK